MATENLSLLIQSQTRGASEIDSLTKQLERLANVAESSKKKTGDLAKDQAFDQFAAKIKSGIQNPLDAAGAAAESFLKKIGPVGAGISVAAVGIAAFSKVAFDSAKAAAQLGDQISDTAVRMGITAHQVDELRVAMRFAGGSIESIEATLRKLSETLADNDQTGTNAKVALYNLGVSAKFTDGTMRPMVDILVDMGKKLREVEDASKRNVLATQILGRSALEVLPDLMELPEALAEVQKRNLALSDQQIKKMGEYQKEIALLETVWEKAKTGFDVFVARGVLGWVALIDKAREYFGLVPGAGGQETPITYGTAYGDTRIWNPAGGNPRPRTIAPPRLPGFGIERGRPFDPFDWKRPQSFRDWFGTAALFPGGDVAGQLFPQWRPEIDFTRSFAQGLSLPSPLNFGTAPNTIEIDPVIAERQVNQAREFGVRLIQQQADAEARRVQLISGPGGEVAAIQQSVAIRLAALEKEKQISEDKTRIVLEEQRIISEGELALQDLRKRGEDEYVNAVQRGFEALLHGRSGITAFLGSQLSGLGSTIAGNLARMTYSGIQGKFQLPGLGSPGAPNALGKLLQGTPFGLDPAAGVNLSAANLQMQAAQIQLQAAAGQAAGGGITGGLLSGATNNPFIFRSSGITGPGVVPVEGGEYNVLQPLSAGGGIGLGRGIGIAGAAAAGTLGAISGIRSGGARGALTASGSIAGSAGAILGLAGVAGPAAPILAAVGLGLGLSTMLFGDPKKKRAQQIDDLIANSRYESATGLDVVVDQYGRGVDYDFRGRARSSNVNVTINALDVRSFMDRGPDLAKAISAAVQQGQAGDLPGTLRQELMPA